MALKAKELVLAGLASFVAWGYATHWFPAIRFAGHGVVFGALLTASGLLALVALTTRSPLYGPASSSTAMAALRPRRPPGVAFVSPELWPRELAALRSRNVYHPTPLYPPMPAVSDALDTLLQSILRTYVRSWYNGISPSPLFPNDVDATIRLALGNLRDRLLAVDDMVELLTSRIVPILTAHFHDFNEAERAVRGRKLNRSITESDELDLAIATKFRDIREAREKEKDSNSNISGLHPAASLSYSDANTRLVQQDYLRRLVTSRLLPSLLPASFLASPPVAVIVREIVACAVLLPVMQLLADPDTWNQLMENYGRTMLQDRSTVRKLRAALDQHASPAPRSVQPAPAFPRLTVSDSERRFERFVRTIRHVNNLSDARRFRSEVASQLKRDSQAGQPAEGQDQQVYLRRLEMCKRLLDQKVQDLAVAGGRRVNNSSESSATGGGGGGGILGGASKASKASTAGLGSVVSQPAPVSRLETASLNELLHDAAALSYFMEYMDRQRMLPLVQFWLVVDGFRNPLEDEDDDGDNDGANEPLPSTLPPWTASDRLDLAQIDHAYLARPELHVPETSRRAVQEFLEGGSDATPAQYYRARRAILRCQAAVLGDMKTKYFQGFKKSDLFYKCLAAEEASQTNSKPATPQLSRASTTGLGATGPTKANPASRLRSKLQANLQATRRTGSSGDLQTATSPAAASTSGGSPVFANTDFLFAAERNSNMRRSLDERRTPSPLFGDDDDFLTGDKPRSAQNAPNAPNAPNGQSGQGNGEHDALADSVQSLDPADAPQAEVLDTKVVEAVEEALSNIMEDSRPTTAADLRASLFGGGGDDVGGGSSMFSGMDSEVKDSPRGSVDLPRRSSTPMGGNSHAGHKETEKPSIASLGLVSAASRIGVFEDDDLFGDDGKYLSDEEEGGDGGEGGTEKAAGSGSGDEVHEAAPGDLGLAEAITALTDDIERLASQEAVVDSLQRKAELTNNTAELRILSKSKASLQREKRRKELQRQQYVAQESDNSLFGRATVRLTGIQLVGREAAEGGKEYARYTIEVRRSAGEGGGTAASWAVMRRYSEFWALHQRLRARYPSVRTLDFPRRRMIMMKLQSDFLQRRRAALERYLRALLLLPDVCGSRELRAFLSQRVIGGGDGDDRKDVMSRLYDSVADGVEDILGSIPVLDQLSLAGQSLIAAATSQLGQGGGQGGGGGGGGLGGSLGGSGLGGSGEGGPGPGPGPGTPELELSAEEAPFVKPICDIFLEVFELNRGNNWLRGRAVVVVLQQLLGGTIERKLRENMRLVVQEDVLLRCVGMVQTAVFGAAEAGSDTNGTSTTRVPRTPTQKTRTRTEAGLMLATLVPDLAGSVVGRVNAQAASRRIFATLNNNRLNTHLAFTLLDEIAGILLE